MEMGEDNKDFKVVDRRASSGEGFTMKEPKEEKPQGPTVVDFSALCLSLATGALINLGLTPDPTTGKTVKNLEMAQHNIEILGLLKDKTQGNLTAEETKLLESLVAEVRMRFVDASKKR